MNKPTLSRIVCILFMFFAATAITAPAQILTTLHSFAGFPSDGSNPFAGLVQASDGNFSGTTVYGGANNDGTVFRITPSGALTMLYNFAGYPDDGSNPYAGLVQASDGNFYGTTEGRGAHGGGTVFKITLSGALTTLYSFCSQSNCSDGAAPYAGLVQDSDGNFYGTTTYGGNNGCGGTCGTVFKITAGGTLTTLYSFCAQADCSDGARPYAGLVQARDGNFYGTTYNGGANYPCQYGCDTVFKITPNGTLTTLQSFDYFTNGAYPYAGLIQATDGNLYGTASYGGADSYGTVFKITPSGTLITLYSFCAQPNCADGLAPTAGLVQARDGKFYGTTEYGGTSGNCIEGCGTIFKITAAGTLTTLHSFGGHDGAGPYAGVVQGSDGNFYGTTADGGANGDGTVFRLVTVRACAVCASVE